MVAASGFQVAVKPTAVELCLMFFVALGSLTYGYSSSIIATTRGQPSFNSYFKLDTASNATQLNGAMDGLFQAGGLFGALTVSYLADKLGRRKCIMLGSLLCVIGGALQAGSVHVGMFIAVRFVTGFGVGQLLTSVPMYQSELSRPYSRGLTVGTHGVMIVIGYTLSSWVGVGFYYVNAGGAQWRVPLAIQVVFPLVLGVFVMFLPESPRWLLMQDRSDEAQSIILRVHRDVADPEHRAAKLEFLQMEQQWQIERTSSVSWKDAFMLPHYRKRMIIGFCTLAAGQATGTLVINNYGPTLYADLGFDSANSLIIQGGWITVSIIGNSINALTIDWMGRKKQLLIGLTGCALALVGECVALSTYERTGGRAASIAAVVFLFLHVFVYGLNMDVTSYVYSSEIMPNQLRAKGVSFSICGLFLSTIVYLEAASTAFANIGWKYYLVFICMSIFFFVLVFFYFPETKDLSLEEMAALFGDEVTDINLHRAVSDEYELDEKNSIIERVVTAVAV
ncbi:general substrate transporter [Kockiozyma suomiensis]|uniref:general substrate transporter n=1 Tax=Kockiozyma suomiensis TaxID=1337062 RepID=UPI0033437D78